MYSVLALLHKSIKVEGYFLDSFKIKLFKTITI